MDMIIHKKIFTIIIKKNSSLKSKPKTRSDSGLQNLAKIAAPNISVSLLM